MLTAAREIAQRLSWKASYSSTRLNCRLVATLCSFALAGLLAPSIDAETADRAFTQTSLNLTWSESPDQLTANLQALNHAYLSAKGSRGARFATYSIRDASRSLFELKDRERRFISSTERTDYSHELELQLKPSASIDYEALNQSKTLSIVVDAVAKREADIRRLVHSSEVDDALSARNMLGTPSSLTITIAVTDVNEPPVVSPAFDPDSNHRRGYLLRLNEMDGTVSFSGDRVFNDPEGQPLYFKPNSEDIEIREFAGVSPNFGTYAVKIGDTDLDTNYLEGNSPSTDGRIVQASVSGTTISITPLKGASESISKAEIWIRGWDQRGPTAGFPSLDPATAEKVAKITVLVQTGTNRLPQWAGNATGFSVSVDEGFEGLLQPRFGTWNATDPDGEHVTYELLDASTLGACASIQARPGIAFAGTCIRLESNVSVLFSLDGKLDYELVREDPVGRFTLLAIDSRGAIAETMFALRVKDIDEPITGGFKTGALSIHLPTTPQKSIDLSDLFMDPEDRDNLTFRATSNAHSIVSVNEAPDPVLAINAHRVGRAVVNVWASSSTGGSHHSSITIIVKNDNNPPTFDPNVENYRLTVAESALVGTKLSRPLTASDPDLGDVLSFRLVPESHFGLTSEGLATNQVQLVTRAPLDFETQSEYILTLIVSDEVATVDTEVRVSLTNTDESVQATADPIPPIRMSVDTVRTLDAKVHFFDEDGQVPEFSIGQYDSSIVDIFIRTNGEVEIYAKRNGSTDAALLATDTLGGVAAKRFSIIVEANEPPVVNQPIPDQTMQVGLRELSMAGLFSDPDGEITDVEVSSSDEDVLWAIIPKNESDTLVLYAWKVGLAEISIFARDSSGNETTHTFTVRVTTEEPSVSDAVIPDQVIGLGQRYGAVSLFEAFATDTDEPQSFVVSSDRLSVVDAVTGDMDLVAWWHSLNCAQKVAAVGDTGVADASNPYCQDFATLRLQQKVIVRAVATHHILLQGIATGSATITVTATFVSGETITATFSVTVEATVAAVAASVPARVVYLDETTSWSIQELVGGEGVVNVLTVRVRQRDLADIRLDDDHATLHIQGREIGSTTLVLIVTDTEDQHHAIQFSVRVANRAPQVSDSTLSMALEVGEEPRVQDLNSIFSAAHALRFELLSPENRFFEARLQESNLIVSPIRKGTVELSLRATDPHGASATAKIEITVNEDRLNEAASKAIAGYGRAILSSVSSVIGSRVREPLNPPDMWSKQAQRDGHTFDAVMSRSTGSMAPVARSDDATHWGLLAGSSAPALGNRSIPRISHTFANGDDTRYWTLWSDSDTQSYDGDNHRGQTRSHYLGTDVVLNGRIQAGIAGSYTVGSGDYSFGNAERWFETEQTMISPYARYQFRDDSSVWSILTIGRGDLATTTRPDEVPITMRELHTSAFILGATTELASVNRLDFDWASDVAHLTMEANALDLDQDALIAYVKRIRSGLTATYDLPISSKVTFEPFATLNVRYDSGSDHEGGGLEAVGGVRITTGAFDIEIRGRRFQLYDEHHYIEQGFAISTTYNLSNDLRGWSFSLAPTWGSAQQSFDPFSSRRGVSAPYSAWSESDSRAIEFGVQGSLNYGILTSREQFVVSPYIETRAHTVNEHRLGLRLQGITQSTRPLEMDLVMRRVNELHGATDTGLLFSARFRL